LIQARDRNNPRQPNQGTASASTLNADTPEVLQYWKPRLRLLMVPSVAAGGNWTTALAVPRRLPPASMPADLTKANLPTLQLGVDNPA
jgi:hypothetical protein